MTDVTNVEKPIVVSNMQGAIDAAMAAIRYLTVLVGMITALLGLFKTRDIAGMIEFIRVNGGEALAAGAGLIAIGTAFYGIFKTRLRGAQIATVAASSKVPNTIAKVE